MGLCVFWFGQHDLAASQAQQSALEYRVMEAYSYVAPDSLVHRPTRLLAQAFSICLCTPSHAQSKVISLQPSSELHTDLLVSWRKTFCNDCEYEVILRAFYNYRWQRRQ